MENSTKLGIIASIIATIMILILGTFIITTGENNYTYSKTSESSKSNATYNVKPLDKSKDIVYTLSNKSYPIINLSGSPQVDNINARIKSEFAEEDDEYNSSEFNYYLNNEILSLVIENTGPTGYWIYDVYNINVKTGKTISNTDLLKIKNIDETTFISKLKECYKSKFIEEHNKYPRNRKRTRICRGI